MDDKVQQKSNSGFPTLADNETTQSLESLSRRLEHAELTIRALDSENKVLRSERTRAMLAAARATEARRDDADVPTDKARQRFEGLTEGMKIAEAARTEAARERNSAITALEEALRQEYGRRITAIQESHAAELAVLALSAEKGAREKVSDQLDRLTREASDAIQALHAAKRAHEQALRETEERLEQQYSQQIEALDRSHAEDLEKLSHLYKERHAEDLMSSLATAHASWLKDTEKQVQQARQKGEKAGAREVARFRRRNWMVIRRAAWVWRARQRHRMAEARREWQVAHVKGLQACNDRWRTKFSRLKHRARRRGRLEEYWCGRMQYASDLFSSYARSAQDRFRRQADDMSAPAHGGIVAALVVILGLNFLFLDGAPALSRSGELVQGALDTELAALPAGHADGRRDVRPKSDAGMTARPALKERKKENTGTVGADRGSIRPVHGAPIPPPRPRDRGTTANPANSDAQSGSSAESDRIEDKTLRKRLQQSIEELRLRHAGNRL